MGGAPEINAVIGMASLFRAASPRGTPTFLSSAGLNLCTFTSHARASVRSANNAVPVEI